MLYHRPIKQKYFNPFFLRKRSRVAEKMALLKKGRTISRKFKLLILSGIIAGGALVWFLFCSSFFAITTVSVKPADQMETPEKGKIAQEIETLVWRQITETGWLFKQNNIFLFSRGRLAKKINVFYNLSDLKIIKRYFHHELEISFREKEKSFVWLENEKYYYLDNQGNFLAAADPLEIKISQYPLVENKGGLIAQTDENGLKGAVGNKDLLRAAAYLFKKNQEGTLPCKAEKFIADANPYGLTMVAEKGPQIIFSLSDDLDKQLARLKILISEKIKNDLDKLSYINLRYKEQVYYK